MVVLLEVEFRLKLPFELDKGIARLDHLYDFIRYVFLLCVFRQTGSHLKVMSNFILIIIHIYGIKMEKTSHLNFVDDDFEVRVKDMKDE